MERYEALARELFAAMDRRKCPPHEDMSVTMRGEMAVLRLLSDEENALSAGSISQTLHMTTSRIAAVLGSLQKKELIIRTTDDTDRRRVLVTLTDKGKALCQRRKAHALADMAQFLAQLGEEDAALFVRLMKRVQEIAPPSPPPCGEDE